MIKLMPKLNPTDVADAVLYAISTPESVLVSHLNLCVCIFTVNSVEVTACVARLRRPRHDNENHASLRMIEKAEACPWRRDATQSQEIVQTSSFLFLSLSFLSLFEIFLDPRIDHQTGGRILIKTSFIPKKIFNRFFFVRDTAWIYDFHSLSLPHPSHWQENIFISFGKINYFKNLWFFI